MKMHKKVGISRDAPRRPDGSADRASRLVEDVEDVGDGRGAQCLPDGNHGNTCASQRAKHKAAKMASFSAAH